MTGESRPRVVSARHFDAWWKKARHDDPRLLTLTRDDLLRGGVPDDEQPDVWQDGDVALPVTYRFEPGAADDGVTVHVPLDVLARLGNDRLRLAGAGAARGTGHRADPLAAEGPASQLRPGAGHRAGGACRTHPRRRAAARRRAARIAPAHRHPRPARRVRPLARAVASAHDVRGRGRGPATWSRAARIWRRCRRNWPSRSVRRWRRRAASNATVCATGRPISTCCHVPSSSSGGPFVRGYPALRSPTPARPSRCACSRRNLSSATQCRAAPAACCALSCRRRSRPRSAR